MSDHAVESYDSIRDLNIALRKTTKMESTHPYQTQWMAHWTRATSSFTPHSQRHCAIYSETNTVQRTENGCMHAKNMNASDRGVTDLPLEVLQPEAVAFDAKSVEPDKFSAHKAPCSSVEGKNFTMLHLENSENFDSEWKNFPMFEINRKIKNILASKRKYAYGTMALRTAESHSLLGESTLASHIIRFTTEEHQFHTWGMKQSTDQWIASSKSIKGLVTYEDDCMRSSSCSTVERFKLQQPNVRSYLRTKRENDPVSSKVACLEHSTSELCNSASHSTLMVSKMNDCNQFISRNSGSSGSLPRIMDGPLRLLTNCCPDDVPFPSITKERCKEKEDDSCSGLLPSNDNVPTSSKFDDFEHVLYRPHKMPKCSFPDSLTQEKAITLNPMESIRGRSQKFLDTAQYLSFTNNVHADFSDRGKSIASRVSSEVKGTASKMLMLPTTQRCHGDGERSSGFVVNSVDSGKQDGTSTNKYFVEMQESSVKTDTMYADGSQSSRSSEGVSSLKSQKVAKVFTSLTEPEKEASSQGGQVMSRNSGGKLTGTNINQPIFSGRICCVNNRELSTSRTESMDADHFASNVEKMDNSRSSPLLECTFGPQTSSTWINRLRHSPPVNLTLGTKRLKMGDATASDEVLPLLSKALNCKESTANISRGLKEKQKSDKTIVVPKDERSTSWDSDKTVNSWIGRWCCKSQQVAPRAEVAVPVLCEPKNLKIAPENLGAKQFPSIGAMALMGRVVSNNRPRELRRRGSLEVWSTKGL